MFSNYQRRHPLCVAYLLVELVDIRRNCTSKFLQTATNVVEATSGCTIIDSTKNLVPDATLLNWFCGRQQCVYLTAAL